MLVRVCVVSVADQTVVVCAVAVPALNNKAATSRRAKSGREKRKLAALVKLRRRFLGGG